MTRVIYKYPIDVTDEQVVSMPVGARPLSVGVQNNTICLWCEVEPSRPEVARRVRVFGTGNPMPDNIRNDNYVGTVMQLGGQLVWHIYIEKDI